MAEHKNKDSITFVKSFLHGKEFFGGMDPVLNYNHNIWKSASSLPCALQLLQIRHLLKYGLEDIPYWKIKISQFWYLSLHIWHLTRSDALQLLQIYRSPKYGLEDIPAFTISNISRLRFTIYNSWCLQCTLYTICIMYDVQNFNYRYNL